jgi:hypothetical protein
MSSLKINSTKNYRLFTRSSDNRDTNPGRRRRLKQSMQKYGFLPYFPIVCQRSEGKLVVKEGQHRLAIAETLGLPVHWVEADKDFDIAEINSTAEVWRIRDYAEKFSKNGLSSYTEGLEFAKTHRLPITIAFALLSGSSSWGNAQGAFISGSFRIKDRPYAEMVAGLYVPLTALSPDIKNARCLQACIMVCRVKEFDGQRLIHGATKCREKLVSYSTREAYLTLFEEIYNFNRNRLFGLKTAAVQAMRSRNAVHAAVAKKKSRKSVDA